MQRQRGLVTVLITASMVAFAGMLAFAVDVNHALVNKTRLQNSVDAAALAAAVALDKGKRGNDIQSIVTTTLNKAAAAGGNSEMDFSAATISVDFSNNPKDFSGSYSSTSIDQFVRVAVSDYPLDDFFASIFGVTKNIAASAVAGPSAAIPSCNIVPMAVCAGNDGGVSGYVPGQLYALKVADQNQTEMGAGNYQLLDFGSGAATVREALAGGYQGCAAIGDMVTTKPGATVGPIGQGLNTRFGVYSGGGVNETDFPPDIYVKEPNPAASLDKKDDSLVYNGSWSYSDYLSESVNCPTLSDCEANGEVDRRMLKVPIVDCTSASGGTTQLSVEAIGCFFLLQQAPTSNAGGQAIFGEYIKNCTIDGGGVGSGGSNEGPYRIVLYKDPLSEES
jgi:Flp pilus assembly protein TadG